jgi:hypothetical protein
MSKHILAGLEPPLTIGDQKQFVVTRIWENGLLSSNDRSQDGRRSAFYSRPHSVGWYESAEVRLLKVLFRPFQHVSRSDGRQNQPHDPAHNAGSTATNPPRKFSGQ